jgi:hypothetical protein
MYTCPERREVFEGTLARWRATDWGGDPVVVVDDGAGPPSLERHVATARRMFEAAAGHDADYFLFLEDDVLFNIHIRHNLALWAPLRERWAWMGTLYNPCLTAIWDGGEPRRDQFARLAWGSYYGSQAVVLSRAAVGAALREWDEPGLLDLKLAGIAARHCDAIVVHCPSLVQQLPVVSSIGSAPHRAFDFDPLFRADGQTGPPEHFYESVPG